MINRIYHLIVDTKIPTLSGGLCFFILLNGGSFLFLLVNFSNYFISLIPIIEASITDGMLKDLIIYLLNHNSNLPISFILLGSSIYSSSSMYYHFISISELIANRHIDYKFGKRIISLLLVPIVLILIYLLIGLLYLIYMLLGIMVFIICFFIFLLMIIFLLNFIVFKAINFKRVYKGGIISSIYIVILTILFLIFINIFSAYKIVYGILSIFIIALIYLYLVIIGIFVGIFINCKNLDVLNFIINKK